MSRPLANAAFLSKREILGPAAICTSTCNLEAYLLGVVSVNIVRGCIKSHTIKPKTVTIVQKNVEGYYTGYTLAC